MFLLGAGNWNSKDVPTTWNWNAMDIGPKRDILGDLAVEVKKQISPQTGNRLKFGVYHSLYEWFSPMYNADKAANYTTQHFVDTKTIPELYDLVNKYEPEILWSDGEWEAESFYWKAREFLHWYATNSTVAGTGVWNDRWGRDTRCKHGSYVTCDDRFNPDRLQDRKFENALTIDRTSWGLNRVSTLADYMTVKELVHTLIQVVAFNGNMLLNIGPGSDGIIRPIFLDRLRGIGMSPRQLRWVVFVKLCSAQSYSTNSMIRRRLVKRQRRGHFRNTAVGGVSERDRQLGLLHPKGRSLVRALYIVADRERPDPQLSHRDRQYQSLYLGIGGREGGCRRRRHGTC